MTDHEFSKLLGELDEDTLIGKRERKANAAARRPKPGFPRWAAAAAAVLLVMLVPFSTAGASGVSVIKPFVAWAEGGLRLDYSAGLDRHEDAPEVDSPDKTESAVNEDSNEVVPFASEEELKAAVGNMLRLPDESLGLEFVSASGAVDGSNVSAMIKYRLDEARIRIEADHSSEEYGSEYISRTIMISGTIGTREKEICGIDCTLIFAARENIISAVFGNEAYLISGNVEMPVLESIFASMMGEAE